MKDYKRVAIYFFYDRQGIVDRFVEYFLNDFVKNVDKLLIVCNGQLNNDGRKKLEEYGEVLVRENKGFDVGAYKTGIEHIGGDNLNNYDELIMLNNTIFGPIYPLSETFDKMNKRSDLDFGGITEYFKHDLDPFACVSYGYLPDHIQSHFIAVRNRMFTSEEFMRHGSDMPEINSYEEAIGKHEVVFTKKFADLGYKGDVSVDMEDLREFSGYPLLMCPLKLLTERRCPIIKRRSFFHNINDSLQNTTGEQASELFSYINNHTNYDVDMIWENILRNYHQYDIFKNLNLVYTLPTDISKKIYDCKVALVYHIYFIDIIDQAIRYLSVVPENFHVYITTDSNEKKEVIKEKLKGFSFEKFEIRVIENRGRDVSSLLVGVKDVVMDYDYVCFAHDKKTTQVKPASIGASFAHKCLENVLTNNNYINNIISVFQENPRLGMLSPPEPNHACFFATIGQEGGPNYKNTKKLAEELNLSVPMSENKYPIAPYGTIFGFRPKALKILFDFNWDYKDFPEEPNKIDGSILHAVERIYAFVVQEAGYYTGICMNDKFAAIEYNNLRYYCREYNRILASYKVGPDLITMTEKVWNVFFENNHNLYLIRRIFINIVKFFYWNTKRVVKKILKILHLR